TDQIFRTPQRDKLGTNQWRAAAACSWRAKKLDLIIEHELITLVDCP
ncbi:jg27355, partial [Pararge aegeria aegeria]